MKLSRNWLSQYVDLTDISDHDLFLRLTMTTAEFEEYEIIGQHLSQIYIGKVMEVEPHPDADKLRVTQVDVAGQTYQIVCGASNVAAGQTVPVALDGSILPGDFKIKNTKIRGIESKGMICSKAELGLEEKSEGIWSLELDQKTSTGMTLGQALHVNPDTIFDIDNKSITHRPDLWNHIGFARELASIFDRKFTPPQPPVLEQAANPEIKVNIQNGMDTPRYCGLIIENFQVGPSPQWLKTPLEAVGLRSINNIVDITNFIMLELGEPLHAFDKDTLTGDTIQIRLAKQKETLITLDSQKRTLSEQDLVIADESGPIALAGVMGGEKTEVTEKTKNIFLEAANFYPARIRRTGTRINLRTDAALRFEKSLDPQIASLAIFRAWELVQKVCPEARCSNFVDSYPNPIESIPIEISHAFIEKRLGIPLATEKILRILNSLEINTQARQNKDTNDTIYQVQIPTFRATKDLSIPEDIVEEIGRVIGYDQIPPQAPYVAIKPTQHHSFRQLEHQIRDIMTGTGHADEVFLYSFYGPKLLSLMGMTGEQELKLKNYLSDEMDRLRMDIVPGLVKAAADNLRFLDRFRIFEIGRTYHPQNSDKSQQDISGKASAIAKEETHLGFIMYDQSNAGSIAPFFAAKDVLTNLLAKLKIHNFELRRITENDPIFSQRPYFHPGRSAAIYIFNQCLGYISELHPRNMTLFDIDYNKKQRLPFFDLNLSALHQILQKQRRKFTAPSKFPPAFFEVTVLADNKEETIHLENAILQAKLNFLLQARVIKVFTGANLPAGKKSVSLGLTFQNPENTLEPETIKKLQDQTIDILAQAGYPLKS